MYFQVVDHNVTKNPLEIRSQQMGATAARGAGEGLISALMRNSSVSPTFDPESLSRYSFTDDILRYADIIALSQVNVVITGEIGTGKKCLARRLHFKSEQSQQPLVVLDCGILTADARTSPSDGHESRCIGRARSSIIDKIEQARGGTLLLNNINKMNTVIQVELLDILEQSEIKDMSVRLITTNMQPLEEEVQQGNILEELYYHLSIFSIDLIPLRKRPHDIDILCMLLMQKYAKANDVTPPTLTYGARKMLRAYAWPGNVHELECTMQLAVILARNDTITTDLLRLPRLSPKSDEHGKIQIPRSSVPAFRFQHRAD
jgi:DNA-binding NtrC family response regulator